MHAQCTYVSMYIYGTWHRMQTIIYLERFASHTWYTMQIFYWQRTFDSQIKVFCWLPIS